MVEQVVKDGIVMQGVAVAVEAGVDVVFVAGGEPVAYEFVLQERFAARCGNAAACDRGDRPLVLQEDRADVGRDVPPISIAASVSLSYA